MTFTIEPGEVFALLGPNRAGKTTLLRAITRLIKSRGSIAFNGQDVTPLRTHELAKRGVIMVFILFPALRPERPSHPERP